MLEPLSFLASQTRSISLFVDFGLLSFVSRLVYGL